MKTPTFNDLLEQAIYEQFQGQDILHLEPAIVLAAIDGHLTRMLATPDNQHSLDASHEQQLIKQRYQQELAAKQNRCQHAPMRSYEEINAARALRHFEENMNAEIAKSILNYQQSQAENKTRSLDDMRRELFFHVCAHTETGYKYSPTLYTDIGKKIALIRALATTPSVLTAATTPLHSDIMYRLLSVTCQWGDHLFKRLPEHRQENTHDIFLFAITYLVKSGETLKDIYEKEYSSKSFRGNSCYADGDYSHYRVLHSGQRHLHSCRELTRLMDYLVRYDAVWDQGSRLNTIPLLNRPRYFDTASKSNEDKILYLLNNYLTVNAYLPTALSVRSQHVAEVKQITDHYRRHDASGMALLQQLQAIALKEPFSKIGTLIEFLKAKINPLSLILAEQMTMDKPQNPPVEATGTLKANVKSPAQEPNQKTVDKIIPEDPFCHL